MGNLLINPIFLFFVGFAGMLCHFLKKFQRDQLEFETQGIGHALVSYFFILNLAGTVITVIAYIITYFILYQTNDISVFSMFSAGYLSDSILNKAENSESKE